MSRFFTRPNFEDRQVVQYSGSSISLSGITSISNVGLLQINKNATSGLIATCLDADGTVYWDNAPGGGYNNMWYVPSGFTLTVPNNYQSFVYGDLYVFGTIDLQTNAQLVILNGNIYLSGGTIIGSGTTYLVSITGGGGSGGTTTIIQFTGNTSASCITDLYVSNIHSCSPLNINPLDEGDIYFGSTSAVTIDLSNNRLGIGTTTPTKKLEVSGSDALIYGITVGRGGGSNGNNVVLGTSSLTSNTTGSNNIAIGRLSSVNNETSSSNIGIGNFTLYSNTGGTENFALGVYSLYNNIDGSFNVSIGPNSLYSNIGGINNISIGKNSNYGNQSGYNNVSIGRDSLYNNNGNFNFALGKETLYYNGTGQFNVAIGDSALKNSVNSVNNIAIGHIAMQNSLSGSTNIAIGNASLLNNKGGDNISLGQYSLSNNTDGQQNIALGNYALWNNITGISNIAIGGAGSFTASLGDNTTGSYNIGIGLFSLNVNKIGDYNIGIGYNTNVSSSGLTNAIAIGSNTIVGASNSMVLGNGVNVGIGTSIPSEKLEVSGKTKTETLQVTSGATTGYVLTSIDSNGNASWQQPIQFTGGSGNCISNFYVTNIHGCSPITIHDNVQSAGSEATGQTSFSFGNNTHSYGDYSQSFGSLTKSFGLGSYAGGVGKSSTYVTTYGQSSFNHQSYTSGDGAYIYSDYSAILGGFNNTIQAGGTALGIFCGNANNINSVGGNNTILGGYGHSITSIGDNNIILGGYSGIISSGATNSSIVGGGKAASYNEIKNATGSVIIGGNSNTVENGANGSAIIGGTNITAIKGNTVYVPDFVIKKDATIPTTSGSTVGDVGSITWDNTYFYVKTNIGWGRINLDYNW